MGIKLILISLALIDLVLLVYLLYYYFQIYKKSLDKIEYVLNKTKNKLIENEVVKNNVSFVKDNDENKTISVKEKVLFDDAFNTLSDEQKEFYNDITQYALSFENTNTYPYQYDKRIRVGQRKTLAIITIKNKCLVVKFKMGSLKVSDDLEPLQLKPIKVTVKNSDDVQEVKKQIAMAYSKQTGALNVSVEGEKEND